VSHGGGDWPLVDGRAQCAVIPPGLRAVTGFRAGLSGVPSVVRVPRVSAFGVNHRTQATSNGVRLLSVARELLATIVADSFSHEAFKDGRADTAARRVWAN